MTEDIDSSRSFKETLKVLEKHITCPICLEVFKDPKTLSCLHTYCRECVNKLIQAGAAHGDIQCPECRGSVSVSGKDGNELPTSFLVNSLIDTYESLTKASDPSAPCENCGKDKVTAFCSDCSLHICDNCVLCHKTMKAFASHTVVKGGEMINTRQLAANNIIKFLCTKHKKKQLELYCQSCEKLICLSCTIIDHKGHNLDFVDTLATLFKSELDLGLASMMSKEQRVRDAITNVEKVKEKVIKQGNQLGLAISETFEKLEAALNNEKKELLERTKQMVEKKVDILQTQADTLLSTQTAFRGLQKFIVEISESRCNEEFVSLKSQISARISELDEKYSSLQLQPKIHASMKYQTSFSTTPTGYQINVIVKDSEAAWTPKHMEVAIKSTLKNNEFDVSMSPLQCSTTAACEVSSHKKKKEKKKTDEFDVSMSPLQCSTTAACEVSSHKKKDKKKSEDKNFPSYEERIRQKIRSQNV